jgi:dUTP pyrophosphatase
MIEFKQLHPLAKIPQFQSELSAGFDLHAVVGDQEDDFVVLAPGEVRKIGTGFALNMIPVTEMLGQPARAAMLILPRSGLGSKKIRPANAPGLIDADYQGEVIVALENGSAEPFTVKNGDRIAQGIFQFGFAWPFTIVSEFSNQTARGNKGFGSTGR